MDEHYTNLEYSKAYSTKNRNVEFDNSYDVKKKLFVVQEEDN